MEFKTIKKNHKNKIIIGGLIGIGLASALIYLPSRAKYRTSESFNIVNGTINYKVPDFKMIAMYSSEDGSNYTEIEKTPGKNYKINEEKSYCTLNNTDKDTEAKLYTDKYGQHVFNNITKSEKCYVWFDKNAEIVNTVLGNLEVNKYTPDFSQIATTDEGIFKTEDNDGTSYYWRGATEDNYLKFAGYCWRIIRINGDGTIRIIYDGESCHQNGDITTDNIAVSNVQYNALINQSNYVGWTYEEKLQRPSNNATATSSNAKTQLENWYNTNITGTNAEKVADGKFCNDRNVKNGTIWQSTTGTIFYYAGYKRLYVDYAPTLTCNSSDVYTLNAGLITADEVNFAGGKLVNYSYYLYNGQNYWTISPSLFPNAALFSVRNDGLLGHATYVNYTGAGLRPVINLRSDISISNGDGTLNNPYIAQ